MSARCERAYEWSMPIKNVSVKHMDIINYIPTVIVFLYELTLTMDEQKMRVRHAAEPALIL